MKKIIILSVAIILFVCGCGKFDITKAKDEFKNKVNSSKAYELKGVMEIYNNEDTFKYKIKVNYQKDDKYRVSMINLNNNHEQIILKNDEGVYVVTPSLNKSFKFESEWPDNSSQSYILSSLLNDLLNDEKATLSNSKDGYVITSTVNYPHNKSLINQKIFFDKDMNIKEILVYDKNNSKKIKVTINSLDLKAKYKKNFFNLDQLIDEEDLQEDKSSNDQEQQNTKKESNDQKTAKVDDIVYPLYVPTNTYLKSKDKVVDEQIDRTILTFNGDKSFIIVEEAANVSKEFEVIPVNGDPLVLSDSIAALSENSLSWTSNNKDYYLTSSNLSTAEMMSIADSMGTVALEK